MTLLPYGGFFDPDKIAGEIAEINKKIDDENLWNDADAARKLLQKKSNLEKSLNDLQSLESDYKNLSELYQIAPDDADVAR